MTAATATKPSPVTVTLAFTERKVNSVRFDAPLDPKPPVRSIYVSNEAWQALGEPESIAVTIQPK